MKLILTQEDLLQAVRLYTAGLFTLNPDANMTIDFKAGRGENGMSAEVDINYLGVTRIAGIADAKPAATPAATSPGPEPAAAPVKKIDGRSSEARAQRKGLFETKPTAPETTVIKPVAPETASEAADEGTTPVDVADTTIDTEAAQREAEAEEILAEAEREGAGPEIKEEEAAPPPAPTQRKSLFADVAK